MRSVVSSIAAASWGSIGLIVAIRSDSRLRTLPKCFLCSGFKSLSAAASLAASRLARSCA